ncbi:MAG: DMT family transporter [Gammaproteobacteria bacterium]|nr:DMT family transporter [Gammaproteobacteria bacterium]
MLVALILIWGTSFLLINRSLVFFSPEQVAGFRLCIGAIVMIIAVFVSGKRLPKLGPAWLHFLIIAVVANLLPFWMIAAGQTTISSGMAGLLMAIMPLVTLVLAHIFLVDESLNRFKLMGFIVGISGVAFILTPNLINSSNSIVGILLVLAAACCYASATILTKRLPVYDPIVASTGTLICAGLVSLALWPSMFDFNISETPLISGISIVLLGILPTAIAMLLYFHIINRAGATFLSNINYVVPVVAYFSGALVLGEIVMWHDILALLLIIAGIVLSRRKLST